MTNTVSQWFATCFTAPVFATCTLQNTILFIQIDMWRHLLPSNYKLNNLYITIYLSIFYLLVNAFLFIMVLSCVYLIMRPCFGSLPADVLWGLFLFVTHSFMTPQDICGEAIVLGDKHNVTLTSSLTVLQNKVAKIILDRPLHSSATHALN